MTLNLAQSTYMAWLEQEESNKQQQVRTYRDYYDGDPPTSLTARQREFLNLTRDKNFGANVCAVIVDTIVERLMVTGFTVREESLGTSEDSPDDEAPDTPTNRAEQVAAVLDGWWQKNRMDGVQSWVYRAALRDREAFVIVGYDKDRGSPAFSHDFAYDGTSGVKVHYEPGTYNKLAFASKRWVVDKGAGQARRRMNLYFPNRIEKWMSRSNSGSFSELSWQPYEDAGDPTLQLTAITDPAGRTYQAAVSWWTEDGTETGEPLGVPVIPFINRDDGTGQGLSEIDNAIPIQDAVNKTLIDMMAAADMTGFGMYWTNGKLPDNVKAHPGAMIPVAPADGAKDSETPTVGHMPAGDVDGLINMQNWLISVLAGITAVPQSRFIPASVRPAEGTQRQEESALVAKCEGLQTVWGNAWEDVQRMGVRVMGAFGKQGVPDVEGLIVSAVWRDAEVRNEREHTDAVAVRVEKLHIPVEQAWREVGYSADEIQSFKDARSAEAAATLEADVVRNQGSAASALEVIGRAMGTPSNGGPRRPGPALVPSKV